MTQPRFSTTALGIILVVVAALMYGAFVLYGARLDDQRDGKRQKLRNKGKHPVTDSHGHVKAREDEDA
jgi:hypothetical protein